MVGQMLVDTVRTICSDTPRSKRMEQTEVSQLMLDIERSMQMRKMLHERLARQDDIDLVEEWNAIEQLDQEISRKIRKHRLE